MAETEGYQTLDQIRAKHALDAILETRDRGNYGNYVSHVKSLPAAILQSGLGQALATELASAKGKATDAHGILHGQLESWLCDDAFGVYKNAEDVLIAITENNEEHYLKAQHESLVYLNWLKKFAVAYLSESNVPQAEDA